MFSDEKHNLCYKLTQLIIVKVQKKVCKFYSIGSINDYLAGHKNYRRFSCENIGKKIRVHHLN